MAHRQFVRWSTTPTPHGNASWAVIDEMVYVRTVHGRKATQLGGSSPESLVGILAWELATECAE
jgi:hypothetical protein